MKAHLLGALGVMIYTHLILTITGNIAHVSFGWRIAQSIICMSYYTYQLISPQHFHGDWGSKTETDCVKWAVPHNNVLLLLLGLFCFFSSFPSLWFPIGEGLKKKIFRAKIQETLVLLWLEESKPHVLAGLTVLFVSSSASLKRSCYRCLIKNQRTNLNLKTIQRVQRRYMIIGR